MQRRGLLRWVLRLGLVILFVFLLWAGAELWNVAHSSRTAAPAAAVPARLFCKGDKGGLYSEGRVLMTAKGPRRCHDGKWVRWNP